jgi:UDP-2,3-diacylglucosamine pyrophosphatase LpxH
MHLSEAQPVDRRRPLWMAYKRREHFVDDDFAALLEHVDRAAAGPVELVLNGDTFDFDNVTQLPADPPGPVDWLARLRGLSSEEWMSEFKVECIIRDHPRFFEALGDFISRGHRAVFVVGNHDVELYWPAVQRRLREALGVSPQSSRRADPVVFCDWFFVSGGDTYVSHGHQYDPNCVTKSPINPLISVRGRPLVRIPFGDLAGRYLLNGMGYFNPHATENFIMSAGQYVRFFFKYMVRTQPLLIWTWFWGAVATFVIALRSHLRPAMRDPLLVDDKVQAIAWRSHATPSMVRKLNALSVPAASSNPWKIMRELWLDRGLLFLLSVYAAWQIILHINIAMPVSPLWAFVPLAVLLPPYFAYAATVRPTVFTQPLLTPKRAELIAKITGVRMVVFGHTHVPEQCRIGPLEYHNGGFWSAAFAEPECLRRIGTQTFVWIRPTGNGDRRQAELYEWPPAGDEPRTFDPPAGQAQACIPCAAADGQSSASARRSSSASAPDEESRGQAR